MAAFRLISFLLILSLTISRATSAPILQEDDEATGSAPATLPSISPVGGAATPAASAATTPVGGATTPAGGQEDDEATGSAPATLPSVSPGGTPAASATTTLVGGATTPTGGATATNTNGDDHLLTFFMHDILGGSRPSAIAVTGIVSNPAVGGQIPFAKLNGAVLPVNNGIPTNNANGGIVSNNNIPFLTGLSGFTSNFGQNNNGGNNNIIGGVPGFPVLDSSQFPSGTTLQKLMFGTMTVFDDELTEGHELGSGLVGKAQGYYIYSSEDGNSQTMAFTVMFKSGSYADSLNFFGVHRTAVAESHLAVMGGTGKYVNAKGFATVKTFPAGGQHESDGVETLLQITVYLAY